MTSKTPTKATPEISNQIAGVGPVVRTTCAYCGVGCGVLARADGAGGVNIKGDPDHPANFGRLCSKGSALGETVDLNGRLLAPLVHGRSVDWSSALDLVATRFRQTIDKHGPDSVAFYVSGQLLTEDYYIANKLMKGFIGSANIDTNSRLCMASSVAGHKRAFGTDTVPGTYDDLEAADLIVLVGSNLAWCHPVLYQRIIAAKAARPEMKIVNIDPRVTTSSDQAALHLALEPGADVALFNGLLAEIVRREAVDYDYVGAHVAGFDGAIDAAAKTDVTLTGLSPADLKAFYDLWIDTPRVVTIYSQGVNQSSSGTDKVNAILNCHLATGRIGKPGAGPFSVTGQPNAMGGREVGGLANMLACHLDLENHDHRTAVGEFWGSDRIPATAGLKAVDMFDAVADGRIKAIWVICTNPAVSMPDADKVAAALEGCDFVVVSDLSANTDTAKLAHVVLPATGWGEKDGTVTNSDRTISRQRPILDTPGSARHDWQILCDVAGRMGYPGFAFQNPAAIWREYAQLSGVAARFGRDFDVSGMAYDDAGYADMAPTRWPVAAKPHGVAPDATGRFFGDGRFFTPDQKARMLALTPRAPRARLSVQYPFRLNTGRIRDQWHTMTRTGKSARLSSHLAEPFLEIHPDDAKELGLAAASLTRVTSTQGSAILRVLISDRVKPGQVFAPIHWTGQTAPTGRIDALIAPVVDAVSGQPESKAGAVHIAPYTPKWHGFAMSRHDITPKTTYWAKAPALGGTRVEMACDSAVEDWVAYGANLFDLGHITPVMVSDPARGVVRLAYVQDGQVVAALFVAPDPVAVARGFLLENLTAPDAPPDLLAGCAGAGRVDPGATVCACFSVGANTILNAITNDGLMTIDAIGAALGAGSNCGSCRPEIGALVRTAAAGVKLAAQ